MLTTGSIWLVEIPINQHFGPRLSTYRHALTHPNWRLELVIDSSYGKKEQEFAPGACFNFISGRRKNT